MTDVTVRSLARTYAARPPVPALRGVDLDLPSGSLTAVLGPSGCGKTTLLRLLAGFDRPDEGTITLGDQVVSSPGRVVPPERRRVGIVPQEGALFPHLDVGANVAFGLRGSGPLGRLSGGRRRRDRDTGEPGTGAPGDHHGGRTQGHDGAEEVPDRVVETAGPDAAAVAPAGPRDLTRGQRERRVAEVLELVGLGGFERRRPHELSGGQQQRVALARALAPEPKVVLLDEPFTALDAGLRSSLRSQVAASLAAAGTTALLVTHDQEEALTMADHLAVMREGRIVQSGTPADAYRHPADVGVAQFLGEAVLVPATVRGRTLECRLGVVALAAEAPVGDGMEVMACLRPEQLVHDRDPGAVMATVEAVEYQGHDAVLSLRLDGLALLARWPSFDLPRAGDRVGLRLVGDAVAFPAPPSTA